MQNLITVLFLIIPLVVVMNTVLIFMLRAQVNKLAKIANALQRRVMKSDIASLITKGEEKDIEDFMPDYL